MEIEYEATFINIDKEETRKRLKAAGVVLERAEFLQKRVVLNVPEDQKAHYTWMRVRDEGNKITMTWKHVAGDAIENQQEVLLVIDNFDKAVEMLEKLGCIKKSYQENTREVWHFGECEIVIDTWPFLEPLVEVEGPSEEAVRIVSEKLGFDWSAVHFDSVGKYYRMKYGPHASPAAVPRLTFDMENPFV